jgi:hypothetical protein
MDLVIEITQWKPAYFEEREVDDGPEATVRRPDFKFRGGCTLLVDMETSQVRYCIFKDITNKNRLARQRQFLMGETTTSLRATYFGDLVRDSRGEPFALLHRWAGEEAWL